MSVKDFSQTFNSMRTISLVAILLSVGSNAIWSFCYLQLKGQQSEQVYMVSKMGSFHATLAAQHSRDIVEMDAHIQSFADLILSNDMSSFSARVNHALGQVSKAQGPILLKWLNDNMLPLYEDLGAQTHFVSDSVSIDKSLMSGQIHGKIFVEVEGRKNFSHYAAEFRLQQRSRSKRNPYGLVVTDWNIIPTYVKEKD